jgi:YD repeat-containing protein
MNVAVDLDQGASYANDKNGNVTEVGTTTFYTYDFDNRLTQSSIWNGTGTTTTTYAYDPFGNRISQTASTTTTLYPSKYYSPTTITTGTSTVATSTDYLYSGATLLGTVDQKMVNGTATGTAIARYIHPDNLGSTNVTSDANWRNGLITRHMGAFSPVRTRERPRQRGSTLGSSLTRAD